MCRDASKNYGSSTAGYTEERESDGSRGITLRRRGILIIRIIRNSNALKRMRQFIRKLGLL